MKPAFILCIIPAYPVVSLRSTSEGHDAKLNDYIRNTGGDLDKALLHVIDETDAERFPENRVSMKILRMHAGTTCHKCAENFLRYYKDNISTVKSTCLLLLCVMVPMECNVTLNLS